MNKSFQYSIRLLAIRDYSEFKLRKKLIEKEFSDSEINETIEKLIDYKYLQEEEYIRVKIKTLLGKGYGRSYIIQKLQQEELKINDDDIIKIEEEFDLHSDSNLKYLIEKKLRYKEIPTDFEGKMKLKRKIHYFLTSKGHPQSKIHHMLSEYF